MQIELINEDNFSAITLSNNVAEIARPLELLNITYFNHIRVFKDFSRISLANNAAWLEHFFNKKYYQVGRFSKDPLCFSGNLVLLWKTMPDDLVIADASKNFNIDNGITIIKSYPEYKDFYLFASTRKNTEINEFYLGNLELLEKFILFYEEKSISLIKQCKPDKAIIHNDNTSINNNFNSFVNSQKIKKFSQLVSIKKISIHLNNKEYFLSEKEYLCLNLLAQGKTKKEAAADLNIKLSTYYRHLENIRNKLEIFSTPKLINLFNKTLTRRLK